VACWDSGSAGFGDSWSGQTTNLMTFTCLRCVQMYNTKDGFIGPHPAILHLTVTDSESYGNMGQQWKWNSDVNGTVTFVNNLTNGNCNALAVQIPGAAQNFNLSTGLPGSYLSNYCRAAGDMLSFSGNTGSTTLIANSTFVGYNPTMIDMGCRTLNGCGSATYTYLNNVYLGYTVPENYYPGAPGDAPGLYFSSDATSVATASYNTEFGVRNGSCGTGAPGMVCGDPLLNGEPAQGSIPPESTLFSFNYQPTSGSPAVRAGTTYTGQPSVDYAGNVQTSPLTMGALVAGGSPPSGGGSTAVGMTMTGGITQ
jgi:hypothetical protein